MEKSVIDYVWGFIEPHCKEINIYMENNQFPPITKDEDDIVWVLDQYVYWKYSKDIENVKFLENVNGVNYFEIGNKFVKTTKDDEIFFTTKIEKIITVWE